MDLPVRLKEIRVDSELLSSIHFPYHIGGRVIVSFIVLGLSWNGSGHLAGASREEVREEMNNVSTSENAVDRPWIL
jgi:hypothetical protein